MPDRRKLLNDVLLVRRFDGHCARLYQESKIRGLLHLYVGEEAVAAGVLDALDPTDNVVATYRQHAHALLRCHRFTGRGSASSRAAGAVGPV